MRIHVGFFFLVILLLFTPSISTETNDNYLTDTRSDYLKEGSRLLFNDRFDEVDSLFDDYIKHWPDDPLGYLYKAGGMIARMSDSEEEIDSDEFKTLTDKVEKMVALKVDSVSGREKAWLYLLKGHARAYRALYESRFGSFVSAVRLGLSTHGPYEDGLKADSTLYDLYLGLGSYHYWKSAKGGILKFLHILKDDKKKGIVEVTLAADSSLISREGARSALIWIWLEEKEYDSVIQITTEFTKKYPDGRSHLWALANAYAKSRKTERALSTYYALRNKLLKNPGNYYNIVETDYAICTLLHDSGRKDEVREHAEKIFDYSDLMGASTKKKQKEKIKKLRDWASGSNL